VVVWGEKNEMGGTEFEWGAGTTCPPLATTMFAHEFNLNNLHLECWDI